MLLLGVSLRAGRRGARCGGRGGGRPGGLSGPGRHVAEVLAAALCASVTLSTAACGGGGGDGGATDVAAALPAVTGAVGEQAQISIPPDLPAPTSVEQTVLVQGNGAPLAPGDAVVVNYTLMNWHGAKLIGSTYGTNGSPDKTQEFVLGGQAALASWNQALAGVRVGSRVEIVTPPAGAFGSSGATAYGITGTDDLVYVLDVVGAYPAHADITGTQPTQHDATQPTVAGDPGTGAVQVKLPARGNAPADLTTTVLIHGSGAPIQPGQRLMVQYTGVDWNTGKQFDSSFGRGIASFVFGGDSVISGWNKGLTGTHVGDRVLLVVPAADAYGAKGVPSAGIRGGDTLVFVVDVVEALG